MLLFMSLFALFAILGLFTLSKRKVALPLGHGRAFNTDLERIYLFVCLLLMFLICGLRSISIGLDTNDYVDSFLDPAILDRTVGGGHAKFELGYVLFVKAIRLFTDNPHVFVFATAVVIFLGLYFFIRENCTGSYAVALLVYVAFLYYIDFSAIRQAMALSIAINCVTFLRRKKWVPVVLFIALGALFHTTALLLAVMVPFAIGPWNKVKIIVAAGLAVAGTLLFEPLVNLVVKIFPIYARYLESDVMSGSGGVGMFALLVMLLILFAGVMLFCGWAKFEEERQRDEFILAIIGSVFTVAINLVGRKYGIFSRMTRYFIPFVMILSAGVYKCCIPADYGFLSRPDGPVRFGFLMKCRITPKVLFYLVVVALMGVYFYTIMKANLYGIIPYSFFFGG